MSLQHHHVRHVANGVLDRARSRVRPVAGALLGLLAAACIGRTLGNSGLEAIPAPADAGGVGNMVVSPAAAALGQRILRFDNRGTPAERAAQRKTANRTMSAACESDYRSGAEGPAAIAGVVTPRPDESSHDASEFWYVQFVCVRDDHTTRSDR
jgi:hypothetical protein